MSQIFLERMSAGATEPVRASTYAACYDLYADVKCRSVKKRTASNKEVQIDTASEDLVLYANERALVPTGWAMQCPADMSIDFLPRSGLGWKDGISIINTPGVVDPDYPCECFVVLVNHSNEPYTIKHGDRVAQMRLMPIIQADLTQVDTLPPIDSNRIGGFGSSGK